MFEHVQLWCCEVWTALLGGRWCWKRHVPGAWKHSGLSHSIHVARPQRKFEFKTESGRCFLMLMSTSILLKLLVLWQDRLQRVNDDCNRVCLDSKCPKLDMQGPEQFFQWRVQTAFCEVPSSLRVDGCWPNQRISGQGKWSRSSDLIASDPVFCWTSLSCQSEFHQNQNSMIPVSQPHDTMLSSWSAIAATSCYVPNALFGGLNSIEQHSCFRLLAKIQPCFQGRQQVWRARKLCVGV